MRPRAPARSCADVVLRVVAILARVGDSGVFVRGRVRRVGRVCDVTAEASKLGREYPNGGNGGDFSNDFTGPQARGPDDTIAQAFRQRPTAAAMIGIRGRRLRLASSSRAAKAVDIARSVRCGITPNGATSSGSVGSLGRRAAALGIGFGGWVMLGARGSRAHMAAVAASPRIEDILVDYPWPEEFPFRAQDFSRYDEGRDAAFYAEPRFVTHIDDNAIKALTKYYGQTLPPSGGSDVAILDICSSWISHLPKNYTAKRIAGLGMNEEELARNEQLTEFAVQDLNVDPILPYEDASFDAVLNAVSVDYMTKPLELFREIHRVLKPGGKAIMSFSNRCFPTKAIAIWTQTGDPDHILIVGR